MKAFKLKISKSQVVSAVGVGLLAVAPMAFAKTMTMTGLNTDLKNVSDTVTYIPELVTEVATALGLGAMVYGGAHIHKKGALEQQGHQVMMKHIVYPIVAGAFFCSIPWFTGSAQKTFFNHTSKQDDVTAGTAATSVKFD